MVALHAAPLRFVRALPGDFPCVRAGPEDRDEPKWWKVGPQVACDWAGQGCGELRQVLLQCHQAVTWVPEP